MALKEGSLVVNSSQGGGTKDTWVLETDANIGFTSSFAQFWFFDNRTCKTMLARTADNIYWVSRYLERADFLARLIEASSRIAALPKTYPVARTNGQAC